MLQPAYHLSETGLVIIKLLMDYGFAIYGYAQIYPLFGHINANKNFFHNLTLKV